MVQILFNHSFQRNSAYLAFDNRKTKGGKESRQPEIKSNVRLLPKIKSNVLFL